MPLLLQKEELLFKLAEDAGVVPNRRDQPREEDSADKTQGPAPVLKPAGGLPVGPPHASVAP